MSVVVRRTERRCSETPAGVMATLASPTLGGSSGISMWEVRMTARGFGPLHLIDSEQIWTVLDGALTVVIDGRREDLQSGDTIVIPAARERQIFATSDVRLVVCGHSDAIARIPGERVSRGTPAWIA